MPFRFLARRIRARSVDFAFVILWHTLLHVRRLVENGTVRKCSLELLGAFVGDLRAVKEVYYSQIRQPSKILQTGVSHLRLGEEETF